MKKGMMNIFDPLRYFNSMERIFGTKVWPGAY